ncbi:hypothetical protein AAIO73_01970 [Sphingomonas sp. T9W2]
MTHFMPTPAEYEAVRVEISNGIQTLPARLTNKHGTTIDFTDFGRMVFCVEIIDTSCGREVSYYGASYEDAIIDAEECARENGVEVHDLVASSGGGG